MAPWDFLAWKIPWTEEPRRLYVVHGVVKSRTRLSDFPFTFHFHALEKEMATHSSVLAWRIPGTGEPGGQPSLESHRVGHNWETSLSLFTSCIGEGNGNPLQCSCLENPRDGGAWWAAVYGVAPSRTQLKWLSSSNASGWLPGKFYFEKLIIKTYCVDQGTLLNIL